MVDWCEDRLGLRRQRKRVASTMVRSKLVHFEERSRQEDGSKRTKSLHMLLLGIGHVSGQKRAGEREVGDPRRLQQKADYPLGCR
jgi:hypothetical protein